jgi:hypothetical protein
MIPLTVATAVITAMGATAAIVPGRPKIIADLARRQVHAGVPLLLPLLNPVRTAHLAALQFQALYLRLETEVPAEVVGPVALLEEAQVLLASKKPPLMRSSVKCSRR